MLRNTEKYNLNVLFEYILALAYNILKVQELQINSKINYNAMNYEKTVNVLGTMQMFR